MINTIERQRILLHFRRLDSNIYHLARKLGQEAWNLQLPQSAEQKRLKLYQIIVNQQLSNQAAQSIWQRLEPLLKSDLKIDKPQLLTAAGLSRAKSLYLQGLADLDLNLLQTLPEDELRRYLLDYKGVGPWTVDMVLLFICGHLDIYIWQDLILYRAAARVFELDAADEMPEIRRRVATFHPYRSALALLLWRAADSGRLPGK